MQGILTPQLIEDLTLLKLGFGFVSEGAQRLDRNVKVDSQFHKPSGLRTSRQFQPKLTSLTLSLPKPCTVILFLPFPPISFPSFFSFWGPFGIGSHMCLSENR